MIRLTQKTYDNYQTISLSKDTDVTDEDCYIYVDEFESIDDIINSCYLETDDIYIIDDVIEMIENNDTNMIIYL